MSTPIFRNFFLYLASKVKHKLLLPHVQRNDTDLQERKDAKIRATALHKETTRRRRNLEQRKQTHEQKEEQHRQKVLAERRAEKMLQTQRYLRATSRRPIPPSYSREGASSATGYHPYHSGLSNAQHLNAAGNVRPYSAMQYPSGTFSARSEHGEVESVLKQIAKGANYDETETTDPNAHQTSSRLICPIKPSKPKITRVYNEKTKLAQYEFVPQPPNQKKSREIFSARPMSAFESNLGSKKLSLPGGKNSAAATSALPVSGNMATNPYQNGQEVMKMAVSNFNKEIQNYMNDSVETSSTVTLGREEEKVEDKLLSTDELISKNGSQASQTSQNSNHWPKSQSSNFSVSNQIQNIQRKQTQHLSNLNNMTPLGSGDAGQNLGATTLQAKRLEDYQKQHSKPINLVAPMRRNNLSESETKTLNQINNENLNQTPRTKINLIKVDTNNNVVPPNTCHPPPSSDISSAVVSPSSISESGDGMEMLKHGKKSEITQNHSPNDADEMLKFANSQEPTVVNRASNFGVLAGNENKRYGRSIFEVKEATKSLENTLEDIAPEIEESIASMISEGEEETEENLAPKPRSILRRNLGGFFWLSCAFWRLRFY